MGDWMSDYQESRYPLDGREEPSDLEYTRLLGCFYYALGFISAFDFGVWSASAVPLSKFSFPASAFPLWVLGWPSLFFLLTKVILWLLDGKTISKALACVAGILLTVDLALGAVSFFLFGDHLSAPGLAVFLVGIAALPVFSVALAVSNRFFRFVCFTRWNVLILPYQRQKGFYQNASVIFALLMVAGLILGVLFQSA